MALLKANTGIGTTNPTSALHVIGDGLVTGVVTASSFSGNASSATYATTAGIATYATSAGIATYATVAGIATYATIAGIATYATTAGIATYATVAGIATYATTAGVATALQTARNFEITGDVVASAISFDGTGNVSLAATIQPNSVGLGTDTFGDYVKDVTGTSNQITVTGGTGEGSTPVLSLPTNLIVPQDLTVTRDLQVNRNLNVTGSITIGGTAAFINVPTLTVFDPDIVLGYRTDTFGNDVSNDNTANHGGIAVASTEGTPLISLYDVGIGETNPATYKKIMWFKEGSFAGLGTDAWLINYAVGIGSTQFPTGTRLAAGSVQFTERDLAVVRNINASGIVTGSSFRPSSGYYQSANGTNAFYVYDGTGNVAFQGTIGASQVNNASGYKVIGFAGTDITFENNAYVAGITTSVGGFVGNLTGTATTATNLADAANITTGTINSARLSGTYNIDISGNAATATYATTAGVATYASSSGIATYASLAGVATYADNAGIATYASTAGVSTSVIGGIGSITQLIVSGISTFQSDVKLADNASLYLGDGNDLRIFHNGSNSFITEVGTGSLFIDASSTFYRANSHTFQNGGSTETLAVFTQNGSVELYYDNSKKFETSGVGVTVYGTLDSQQLNISGISTLGVITSGNIYSTGIVTALNFVGNLTGTASTASFATTAFNLNNAANITTGTISSARLSGTYNIDISGNAATATYTAYAANAGIATNLKGGSGGSIPYQTAADTTAFLANGLSGYILQSNGGTNAPSWVKAAPAGAITGITIKDEGDVVGVADSISQLDFVGNIVSIAATSGIGIVGIATITFLDYVSNAGYSTLSGISSTLSSTASVNTSGIITATKFYGDGSALTGIIAEGSGIGIQNNNSFVGTAQTVNFGNNLIVTTPSSGIVTVSVGNASQWVTTSAGIHTLSNVGVGTTNPLAGVTSSNTTVLAAGIVTAYKFYGDGSELTGILKILTIGRRVGVAMTINLATSSFNVSGRSGNIVINI